MTGGTRAAIDIAQVKAATSIVAVIGETLALQRDGRHHRALCPFHGEKTPSFYVYDDGYHCFGCGAHGDVLDWLMITHRITLLEAAERLAGGYVAAAPPLSRSRPAKVRHRPPPVDLMRLWNEGADPAGTPVETYLRHRGGLWVPDGAPIRFHPRCQRGPRDLAGGPEFWPAMLALMTDPVTGQSVGLHRTYLRPDGSAKAPDTIRADAQGRPVKLTAKRILGTWGVIRLAEPDSEGLGLAEGIETALSVMQRIGWGPVWAAGTAGGALGETDKGIAGFPVLPGRSLSIFADNDLHGKGLAAARRCAARWTAAGAEVLIHLPPPGDWNDAIKGIAA